MINYDQLVEEIKERDIQLQKQLMQTQIETREYNKRMQEQLDKLMTMQKFTLSEQERQRIALLDVYEICEEIQGNICEMRAALNKLMEKDTSKAKEKDVVIDWAKYGLWN